MSSSPVEPSEEPVELFLIGRTLRGTLGDAFRRDVIASFESLHAGADGEAEAPLHSGLSRTVELTAVAVTRAGALSVDTGIADPAFRSSPGPLAGRDEGGNVDAGERIFEVTAEEVDGISPVAGPPGVDRSRRVVVRVRPDDPGARLDFRVTVVVPE
ncbi:hypothetical protein [Herbiconiux ginsengi]|uniref:Uncharacterized protein n=1 Tax=Herbiconiux ginsengi TaxID=381665 RepID=A0A1H3QGI8_9MICO|nr:hypothetical protein [Herbiconiux ginsengi]SDZ12410.1 hypothetical protein SAMN05216554_2510 [Herbiconiux ginsengi]